MSSSPSTTTSAALSASTYWCHECDMSILLSPPPPPLPPRCPHCHNSFLQHMDSFPPSIWAPSNPSSFFPSLSDLSNSAAAVTPPGDNFLLNRPYLHRLIHHLTTSASGEGGGGGGGGGGDFYDPPPMNPVSARASRATIEALKTIRIGGDLVEFCSICKDQFGVDSVGNELPCGHIFHNGCIVPWLEINNTCPLCRFRLESEEEEEEELAGDWLERTEETYIGAMRLDELLDDGDGDGEDEGDYENRFRQLMRIERGGVWNNEGGSEGGRMMFSPTQIGEAGTGGVVDRANSVETVSSWPVWQAEGEKEVGTSDVENVVRA